MSTTFAPPSVASLFSSRLAPMPAGDFGAFAGRNDAAGALAPKVPGGPDDSLGAGIGRAGRRALPWMQGVGNKLWGNGALFGALSTGALGGLLGYGGASLVNMVRGGSLSPDRVGALGALLGAGAGAYLGSVQKRASTLRSMSPADIEQTVIAALAQDSSIDFAQRAAAASAVQSLSSGELKQLVQFLSTAGGATIGALVLRFLMGKGLLPLALGAAAGAMLGSHFSTPRNALGQRSLGARSFFG